MKARTWLELFTLSSNLYMIARDQRLFERLNEMANKAGEEAGTEEEQSLLKSIVHKAGEAKKELETRMEEIAVKAYDKMHIAHSRRIEELQEELEQLKKELALSEARIISLENTTPKVKTT